MIIKKYLVTTEKSPDGIIFGYHADHEGLMFIEIKQENIDLEGIKFIFTNVFLMLNDFLNWCKKTGVTVVQLEIEITFQMFWDKYNDKERSSKKRAENLWKKMGEADQVKAYYFIDRYNRNRGTAEKKYAETYLNAEMWNN